jgi:trehalose 6-phosphate synthase
VEQRQIIVASNRGPVSFARNEAGQIEIRRGMGGLVTALTAALELCGGLWVASAMSEEDRERAARGRIELPGEGLEFGLRYLSFDPAAFDRFYNGISNRILWFLHHYLWETATMPRFDHDTGRAWEDYREVNEKFAAALAEEGDSMRSPPAYLVQDYHLSLVPAMLRRRRPGAHITHFSHTPFAGPNYFRILPRPIREELLAGLLGADVLGFQSSAWVENFLLSCRSLPGARVDLRRRSVAWEGRRVPVRVYPISIDPEQLKEEARSAAVQAARRRVTDWLGGARLVLRVDRAEPSKNILRGFLAFGAFLRRYPQWRRRVRFLALANPTRSALPEYRDYLDRCRDEVGRLNRELGEPGWEPIEFSLKDDHPRALAAYELYDVLVVNPVIDGMNLVAKEGPALNRTGGVLILSENAGAYDELGKYALGVNPFDVDATADAIAAALDMAPDERARRARNLRAALRRNRVDRWVTSQLKDLERVHS